MNRVAVNLGQSCNRRAARAIELSEKGSLAVDGDRRRRIVEQLKQVRHLRIILANSDADCPLRYGRQHHIDRKNLRGAALKPQPLQPGKRKYGCVGLALLDLLEPGFDIATKIDQFEVGTQAADLRLTAQRRRSEHRARWQLLQRAAILRDQRIAYI